LGQKNLANLDALVMNRSRRGEKVFKDNSDYLCFLDLLQETSDLFNIGTGSVE
jgi:hypothetical protein